MSEKIETQKNSGVQQLPPLGARNIFPQTLSEVPPIERLQNIGSANLDFLLRYWSDNSGRGKAPVISATPSDVVKRLLSHISSAKCFADDNQPLVPDFRTIKWVEPGDTLRVYVTNVSTQANELYPAEAIVQQIITPNSVLPELILEIDLEKYQGLADFRTLQYNIFSPYLLRPAEADYFYQHPEKLDYWLSLCGSLYTTFALNTKLKEMIKQEFASENLEVEN